MRSEILRPLKTVRELFQGKTKNITFICICIGATLLSLGPILLLTKFHAVYFFYLCTTVVQQHQPPTSTLRNGCL